MNYIKLYAEEYDPGVTLVSNVFIDYFLKEANDAQIKIYLYLVRHISNRKPFTISNIADEFNYTESDILRSLRYWEGKQVISLEYDGDNSLIGIELHEVNEELVRPKAQVQLFAMPTVNEAKISKSQEVKPKAFSPSELIELNKDSNWLSIKSIAECYFERTLSASDVQILAHIYKELGFSVSEVDSLIEECLSNDKKTLRSIKKVADDKFAAKNINPAVMAILNALGEKGTPTSDMMEYVNKWTKDMSLDLILEGCKKASLATTGNRFSYADGIFRNWKKDNIRTIADVAASEETFRKNKELSRKAPVQREVSNNKFKQYKQTQYDFEALEREVGIN